MQASRPLKAPLLRIPAGNARYRRAPPKQSRHRCHVVLGEATSTVRSVSQLARTAATNEARRSRCCPFHIHLRAALQTWQTTA